ncbi:MAG: RNA polymerase sigma factor [Acidiferrobacterales bacterium]
MTRARTWEGKNLDSTQALERFLASVERRAFLVARMATGDGDEALDLVQDAMLRLVKNYGRRPQEEWGPLFNRILQSCIRDWFRRSRVRHRFRVWLGGADEADAGDPLEQQPDRASVAPDERAQAGQTISALEGALAVLPLRQRQAFLLRVWEDLDVAQTAKAMSCSEGSVKTHYFRAVRALRERLTDYWPS